MTCSLFCANRKKQSASDPNSRLSMNKVHVYVQMCCPHCCFGPLHTHVRRYLLSVHTTHTHAHTHTHTLTHTHTHWQMWAVNPFTWCSVCWEVSSELWSLGPAGNSHTQTVVVFFFFFPFICSLFICLSLYFINPFVVLFPLCYFFYSCTQNTHICTNISYTHA